VGLARPPHTGNDCRVKSQSVKYSSLDNSVTMVRPRAWQTFQAAKAAARLAYHGPHHGVSSRPGRSGSPGSPPAGRFPSVINVTQWLRAASIGNYVFNRISYHVGSLTCGRTPIRRVDLVHTGPDLPETYTLCDSCESAPPRHHRRRIRCRRIGQSYCAKSAALHLG
jgi:hypothetical protein